LASSLASRSRYGARPCSGKGLQLAKLLANCPPIGQKLGEPVNVRRKPCSGKGLQLAQRFSPIARQLARIAPPACNPFQSPSTVWLLSAGSVGVWHRVGSSCQRWRCVDQAGRAQ
jgi:hypothetical protein